MATAQARIHFDRGGSMASTFDEYVLGDSVTDLINLFFYETKSSTIDGSVHIAVDLQELGYEAATALAAEFAEVAARIRQLVSKRFSGQEALSI